MLSKRRYKKEKNIPTLELRQLKLIQVKLITGTRYHRELCHFMIGHKSWHKMIVIVSVQGVYATCSQSEKWKGSEMTGC